MKSVALILAFYFFLGSLFPLMDFSQMAKMANLWEHYQLHRLEAVKTGDNINFASFLTKHFIECDQHSHTGDSNHQNLPLTQFQGGSCFLPSKSLLPKYSVVHTYPSLPILDDNLPAFDHFNSVFRPPIFA